MEVYGVRKGNEDTDWGWKKCLRILSEKQIDDKKDENSVFSIRIIDYQASKAHKWEEGG